VCVSFCFFLWIEKRASNPILPLHLFNSSSFNVLLLLGAVLNGTYYGSVFVLSLYLQNVLHYPSMTAGLAFVPLTVGFVISNLLSGKIINRFGIGSSILSGLPIFAVGFAGLFWAGADTPYWQLFIPFLIMPIGMGIAVPAMITGILGSVNRALSGTASAVLSTIRQTGGAIGVATFGALAAGGPAAIILAIPWISGVSIILILLTLVFTWRYVLPQVKKHP